MRNPLCVVLALCSVSGCVVSNQTPHNDLGMAKAEIAAESFCEQKPFPMLSECVREQFNVNYPPWQSDGNADLVLMFISWTEAASDRVKRGEMSEASAWQGAYQLYARLKQLAGARYQAQQISSERAAAIMYAGIALIALGQQRPEPSAIITCQGNWVGRTYYTTCN